MRRLFLLSLLLVSGAAQAATYGISPTGSDSADCSTAHPCLTVEHVRDVVRTHIADGMTDHDIINLRGGTYQLSGGVAFTSADSGRDGKRVVWRSYPGEQATISGLQTITGWTLHSGSIYKATVGTEWNFRQLYVNGNHLQRARSSVLTPADWARTSTGYTAPNSAIAAYGNPTDIEFITKGYWTENRIKMASAVGTAVTMRATDWAIQNAVLTGFFLPEVPTYIENAYELLSAGSWYLDRTAGILYVWLSDGTSPATKTVKAPLVANPITLTGVDNITFSGLTFDGSTWLGPDTSVGYVGIQSGYQTISDTYPGTMQIGDAGITVNGGSGVTFSKCTVVHMGSRGMLIKGGTTGTTITGNRFSENAGGDLQIGDVGTDPFGYWPVTQESNPIVEKNLFAGGQFDYGDQGALFVPAAVGAVVTGNEVAGARWTGIAMGWGWNPARGFATHYTVENNYVHHAVQDLPDGGGIYTNGFGAAVLGGPDATPYYFEITPASADAPLWFDLTNAPSEFWTRVQPGNPSWGGGGDIRVVRADTGEQVPHALSRFYTGELGPNQGGLFIGSAGSAHAAGYRVYYGNGNAKSLAAGSTYGQNAVWDTTTAAVWPVDSEGAFQPDLHGGDDLPLYVTVYPESDGLMEKSVRLSGTGYGKLASKLTSDVYSVSMLVKFSSLTTQPQYVFSRGTTGKADSFGVYQDKWIILANDTVVSSGTSVATDTWYHAVFMRNENSVKLVVNNAAVIDWTANTHAYSDGDVVIGQRADIIWGFYGYFDQVQLWDGYNPTDAKIATMYANQLTQTGFWTVGAEVDLSNTISASGSVVQDNYITTVRTHCLYADSGSAWVTFFRNVCQNLPGGEWFTSVGTTFRLTASGSWSDRANYSNLGYDISVSAATPIASGPQPKGTTRSSVMCSAGSGCAPGCGVSQWSRWTCKGNNGLPGFSY
jgi:hypothetical protein